MFKIIIAIFISFLLTSCGYTEAEENLPTSPTKKLLPVASITPGNNLVEYDSERDIYFSCKNQNYDIYFGESCAPFLSFWIISKEPLDTENIRVEIPIQNNYSIFQITTYDDYLGHITANPELADPRCTFSPYLYQSYFDVDWEKIYLDRDAPITISRNGQDMDLDYEFNLLEPDNLPQFHAYFVDIYFEKTVKEPESFDNIDLYIGDTCYALQVGEVRLSDDPPLHYPCDLMNIGEEDISSQTIMVYGTPPMLYNDGIDWILPVFDFTAPFQMELLDFYLMDEQIALLDVRIQVNSTSGNSMDLYWDCETPIYLNAGDHVMISTYYRDDRSTQLSYTAKAWAGLDFECEKGRYSAISECTLRHELNLYELYAIVFDGVDMESYYKDYYFPVYEDWRQDYAGR